MNGAVCFFGPQVILGGGRRHFMPKVARDPEAETEEGRRLDGRNLIDDWVRDKKKRNIRAQYVWNKGQFDDVDPANVDHLLGTLVFHSVCNILRRSLARLLDYQRAHKFAANDVTL
jgi:alkaline phosphatase